MTGRPRLLDLFCGAGGAATGYARAGFDVVGVDHVPQPRYPFEFHQADAMTFPLDGFDAVHASPPCQRYAPVTRWRGYADDHPDLLAPTIWRMTELDVPWVVENVPGAPFGGHDLVLCGTGFGLPFRRHRWFAAPWAKTRWPLVPPCRHDRSDHAFDHGGKQPESVYRDALGCHWMTAREARDAIPPAYTQWIGEQLAAHLKAAA